MYTGGAISKQMLRDTERTHTGGIILKQMLRDIE
jgi:hypothetical protein